MPKTTQKKGQKLAKPGKFSDDREIAAYDIADSLNKINSLGKSSRTGNKTNADSYEGIKGEAAYLYSLLKDPVKEDTLDVMVHLNLINSCLDNIFKYCQQYNDKNRGFRWSSKGRARVREVKRLQLAVTRLLIDARDWQPHQLLNFDTYAQAYSFGPYISSVSEESDPKKESTSNETVSSLPKMAPQETEASSEESDLEDLSKYESDKTFGPDSEMFNDHLMSFDDILGVAKYYKLNNLFSEITFITALDKIEGAARGEDNDYIRTGLAELYYEARKQYRYDGEQYVEMIWNSYRYEGQRKTKILLPELKEYIKGI